MVVHEITTSDELVHHERLPKFRKSMSDLQTLSDRMIWLLRNMGSLKSVPENFNDKSLEKLFDISNFTAMTYEEQMDYLAKYHART